MIGIFVDLGARFLFKNRKDAIDMQGAPDLSTDESPLAAEVLVRFCAIYETNKPTLPPKEVLEEFGRVNALFHVWPYWREFLNSTCSRIGISAITLPMMTVAIADKKVELKDK